MFIYNFKINGTKTFKFFFSFMIIMVIIILCVSIFKIFNGANKNNEEEFIVSDSLNENDIFKIDGKNFTSILRNIHDNIDTYVGKKICYTGYVYRVEDINDNQFILARNMIISSDNNYVVAGFLCEYNKAKDYNNNTWLEITGEIKKGSYHGSDMPILNITDVKEITKPNDEYVYPPDESYIPTSSVL